MKYCYKNISDIREVSFKISKIVKNKFTVNIFLTNLYELKKLLSSFKTKNEKVT